MRRRERRTLARVQAAAAEELASEKGRSAKAEDAWRSEVALLEGYVDFLTRHELQSAREEVKELKARLAALGEEKVEAEGVAQEAGRRARQQVWQCQRRCAVMQAGMAQTVQAQVQVQVAAMLPKLIQGVLGLMEPGGMSSEQMRGMLSHSAKPFKPKGNG